LQQARRVSAMKGIDIFVISLPSATERRLATAGMLDEQGLEWSFFDAHTSLECRDLLFDKALTRRHYGRDLTKPQVAVFSSHYAVWKAFLEGQSSEYLLVLEDDIILDTAFPVAEFAAFCARFGIDYVRLFGKHYTKATRLGFFYDRALVRFGTTPTGAQAYLLSVAGAQRLVGYCRTVDATIDIVMDRFWDTGLPLYSIFPYPVVERFVPTSIPIPAAHSRLSREERRAWDLHRAVNKIRKIGEDWRLSGSDGRLRRRMPAFHQVE
jgi:glycosyl transferase, family 25